MIPRVYTPPEKHYAPEKAPRAWTLAAIVLGVAAFVLGFIGFHQERPLWGASQEAARGFHWSNLLDNLYRTIRLFVFEAERLDARAVRDLVARADATAGQGYNWYLGIARLLAPAATVAAIVRFGFDYLRGAWRAVAAQRWRGHVVVVGAGEIGAAAAREIRRAVAGKRRLAVVERDRGARALAGLQARGAHVVIGDATDEATLRRAGVVRAAHVVVACGGDAANLDIAARVARVAAAAAKAGRDAPAPIVHMQLSALGAAAAETFRAGREAPGAAAPIVAFDLHALAARRLLDRAPIAAFAALRGQPRAHAVIVGLGATGRAVLLQAAQLAWHPLLAAPRFTILDRDAERARAWLAAEHPALGEVVGLDIVAADPLALDLAGGDLMPRVAAASPVTAVFCCLAGIEDNLALALKFRAAMAAEGAWRAPVFYRARSAAEADLVGAAGARPLRFEDANGAFGLTAEGLSGADILNEQADALARIVHDRYRAGAAPGEPGEAASRAPWERLAETYRAASRSQADSLRVKLAGGGYHVAAKTAAAAPLAFAPDIAERLAAIEHARWCVERGIQGWRRGPARDDRRRRHPDLVPWDALGEAARAKDRAAVALVPELVAAAGLAGRVRRDVTVILAAAPGAGIPAAFSPAPIAALLAAAPSRLSLLALGADAETLALAEAVVAAMAPALGLDPAKPLADFDRLRLVLARPAGGAERLGSGVAANALEWSFELPFATPAALAAYAAPRGHAAILAGPETGDATLDALAAAIAGKPVLRLTS